VGGISLSGLQLMTDRAEPDVSQEPADSAQVAAPHDAETPPPGKTEPMHHHHWPGFLLDWDTGGKSPHIRYHRPGNIVRDVPSQDSPVHPGRWSVHWMKSEPMHAIETVENYASPNDPPSVRVEIKVQP
jgi:hypothetical protein